MKAHVISEGTIETTKVFCGGQDISEYVKSITWKMDAGSITGQATLELALTSAAVTAHVVTLLEE